MQRKLYIAALTAAVLSTGLATSASAAVAKAEIKGFTIELIDLDLSDSITPSFTFNYQRGWNGSYFDTSIYGARIYYESKTPIQVQIGKTGVYMFPTENGLSSGATALDRYTGASSQAYLKYGFTLTPHTQVKLSATSSISTLQAGGSANARTWFGGRTAGDTPLFFDTLESTWGVDGASTKLFTGTFSSGDTALNGVYGLYASVGASAPPIPEPATYGMLLAGLGVLGMAARRRPS